MQSVLILGGTGFIGSHTAREFFAQGFKIKIFHRGTSDFRALEGIEFEKVRGNLKDPASLEAAFAKTDVIVHAAAPYPIYSLKGKKFLKSALGVTLNVIEAAKRSFRGRMIYVSSLSTIGLSKSGLADETTPYHPITTTYHIAKKAMEEKFLEATRNGLDVVIVNPTGCFGERDIKPTSGEFIVRILKQKIPALIKAPMNVVDIHDVAHGVFLAYQKGKSGERYILGGEDINSLQFAKLVAELAQISFKVPTVPAWLARFTACLSEWIDGYLLRKPKPSIPVVGIDLIQYSQHLSSAKAEKYLGYTHQPIGPALERTIQWFRAHGYV